MFTGLVEALGRIERVSDERDGRRITIIWPELPEVDPIEMGESIAVNGCCLTVIRCAGAEFDVQAGPETLERTNLNDRKAGDRVNLESLSRWATGWADTLFKATSTPRPSSRNGAGREIGNSWNSASMQPGRN